ncbi:hypothetical protein FHG87_014907 [Trinorchestia longiramus]|nr:hypothetical protein FHG87_014907 [Trinorchestia longiramus]
MIPSFSSCVVIPPRVSSFHLLPLCIYSSSLRLLFPPSSLRLLFPSPSSLRLLFPSPSSLRFFYCSLPPFHFPRPIHPNRMEPPPLPRNQDCHELWSKRRKRQLKELQQISPIAPPQPPQQHEPVQLPVSYAQHREMLQRQQQNPSYKNSDEPQAAAANANFEDAGGGAGVDGPAAGGAPAVPGFIGGGAASGNASYPGGNGVLGAGGGGGNGNSGAHGSGPPPPYGPDFNEDSSSRDPVVYHREESSGPLYSGMDPPVHGPGRSPLPRPLNPSNPNPANPPRGSGSPSIPRGGGPIGIHRSVSHMAQLISNRQSINYGHVSALSKEPRD